MKKIIVPVLLILTLLIDGCSSFNKTDGSKTASSNTTSNQSSSSSKDANLDLVGKPSGDAEKNNQKKSDPLDQADGPLSKRIIYFEYDSSAIKPEFNSVIEAHGKYLAANTQKKIVIQGNTDERGGTEYNLALGQRRAESVRKTLSLIGVSESQMEAVSFGKENPKDSGHDEAAWSQNRRAEIIYK
jgi:peptidoglycan-associated lipoprotein